MRSIAMLSSLVAAGSLVIPVAVPTRPDHGSELSAAAVPACTATDTVILSEFAGDTANIVARRLDGVFVRRIYTQTDRYWIAFDIPGGRALASGGLIDLATGTLTPVSGADSLRELRFIPGLPHVVGMRVATRDADPTQLRSEILDVSTGAVAARFDGFGARAAADGTIFYLHAVDTLARSADGRSADTVHFVDVMRWNGTRGKIVARVVVRPDEDGPYAVTEVVPLPDGKFAYRISDGHEHRYYGADGKSFYAEKGRSFDWEHNGGGGGGHKEQYGLVVAPDGRTAAFAERDWNKLTVIVVVDLVGKKRIQTKYFGSFPRIHGAYVLFVSDPSFVTRGGDFRQIEHFVAYAYHVPTGALCEITRFSGMGGPE